MSNSASPGKIQTLIGQGRDAVARVVFGWVAIRATFAALVGAWSIFAPTKQQPTFKYGLEDEHVRVLKKPKDCEFETCWTAPER